MRKKHCLLIVVAALLVLLASQGPVQAQEEPPPGCIPEDPRPECQGPIVNPPPLPGLGPPRPLPRDGGGDGGGGGGGAGGGGVPGVRAEPFVIVQESEQDVESGDASQTIIVSGGN